MPAWQCADNLPLPPTTFTIAEAAKAKGYATIHVGKWHLGNFFPKENTKSTFANKKWPTSSPRVHGFDEWHSTEASASSSMCNCGCDASWPESPGGDPNATQGVGCITGGGEFTTTPLTCTNYWSPTDLNGSHVPGNPACAIANESTLEGCVGNLTSKILGDDSMEIMDRFEDFLKRKAPGGSEEAPFMAVLWLHTNHVPHPVRPRHFCGRSASSLILTQLVVLRNMYVVVVAGCTVGHAGVVQCVHRCRGKACGRLLGDDFTNGRSDRPTSDTAAGIQRFRQHRAWVPSDPDMRTCVGAGCMVADTFVIRFGVGTVVHSGQRSTCGSLQSQSANVTAGYEWTPPVQSEPL